MEMVAVPACEPVAEEDIVFLRIAPRAWPDRRPSAPGRADRALHRGHGRLYFPRHPVDRNSFRPPHGEDEGGRIRIQPHARLTERPSRYDYITRRPHQTDRPKPFGL